MLIFCRSLSCTTITYYIQFTMQNLHLSEFLAKAFQCNVHYFKMFGGPRGTGCDEVHFLVYDGWSSRDVSVAGVCDCVKECMSFVM